MPERRIPAPILDTCLGREEILAALAGKALTAMDVATVAEAYKPPARRRYGYYVLALPAGGRFVGRTDPPRDGDDLVVLAAHPETWAEAHVLEAALDEALYRLRRQLGCAALSNSN